VNPVRWLRDPQREQTARAFFVGLVVGWVFRDAPYYLAHAIGGVGELSDRGMFANALEAVFGLVIVFIFLLTLTVPGLVLFVGSALRLWRVRRAGRQPSLLVNTLLGCGVALLMPAVWFFGQPTLQSWFGIY